MEAFKASKLLFLCAQAEPSPAGLGNRGSDSSTCSTFQCVTNCSACARALCSTQSQLTACGLAGLWSILIWWLPKDSLAHPCVKSSGNSRKHKFPSWENRPQNNYSRQQSSWLSSQLNYCIRSFWCVLITWRCCCSWRNLVQCFRLPLKWSVVRQNAVYPSAQWKEWRECVYMGTRELFLPTNNLNYAHFLHHTIPLFTRRGSEGCSRWEKVTQDTIW